MKQWFYQEWRVVMEIEKFTVSIEDSTTKVLRERDCINFKGELKHLTLIRKSKNTDGDIYDRRIGITVAILKSLGFSRRIVGKISEILLEENNRINR